MPKPSEKKKQFSAKPSHSRSASYGRNMNKLARITSVDEMSSTTAATTAGVPATLSRPRLNRSRSTDSNLARRNRSFTKLSALHPLTRTGSHQQFSSGEAHGQNKVGIDLQVGHQDSSEDDENGDQCSDAEELEEEEVDEFSDEEGLEQPEPEPQQVLSYKAPPQFSHLSIPEESPLHGASESLVQPGKSLIDSEQLAQAESETPVPPPAPAAAPKEPSEKELAQYYQNMILSQSTGAVRAFGDQPFQNSLVPEDFKKTNALQYIHSNDHISGTLNGDAISKSSNSLRPFSVVPLSKIGSSDETSSMLSFKAGAMRNVGSNNGTPLSNTPSNFNQFLKSTSSNIETRTQQKLWLQRENSLMDVTQVNASTVVNPQVRREFERISREFLNVRRFVNPLTKAVKRSNVIQSSHLKPDSTTLDQLKSEEIQSKLLKLWVQGERKPKRAPNQSSSSQHQHQNYLNHYHQQHQQRAPLLNTTNNNIATNGYAPLRSPGIAPPTTRAVDRANLTPDQNKKIDLAAMR